MDSYIASLQQLFEDYRADDCDPVIASGPALVAEERFRTVSENGQASVLTALTSCALQTDNLQLAFDTLERLAPISWDPAWAWRTRMLLALDFEDGEQAVAAFKTLADEHPADVSTIRLQSIWALLGLVSDLPGGDDIVFGLHETLWRVGYAPPEPLSTTQGLRIEHARLLLARGRPDEARERLGRVEGLGSIVALGADKAFDGVLPHPIDFVATAENAVTAARGDVAKHPGLLESRYRLVSALRAAAREEEALAEADAALAEAAADPTAFEDADEYSIWVRNDRAYSLYALGRADEGREAMREAMMLNEQGGANVSQVINLSLLLVDEERPSEALATLALMGQASPYGEMFANAVRVCAAVQTGDGPALDAALSHLREHADDNPSALQRGLLCAGEIDEAAALYVRRLGDPELRGEALTGLQRWAPDPSPLPFRTELARRLDQVRDRPEVQAAIEAVGRVQDIPYPSSYWGDL